MENRKRKAWLAAALLLIIFSLVFFCLAYQEHKPFEEAKVKIRAVKETVVEQIDPDDPMSRQIDFETLKEINPEIIGWLYIPQIGIDSPVLKGQTDTEYLTHDFEGNYSPLGSVFTWAEADASLSGPHICLFAHNMASGQMFGRLKEFKNPDFQGREEALYLYTPERSKKLVISSVQECHMSDDIFQNGWNEGEGICQKVTLATCTGYSGTAYRLAVTCDVVQERIVL